jgi:serine/threonine protein kinase
MDRKAYAAAAVDDASNELGSVAESQVRSLPEALSEGEACAEGHVSTFDDATGASEQRAALLSPGTCVAGKYILCDVLGTGGSAVVYAAEQVSLKRVVAFKLYPARGALASTLLQRFEREAQLLARIHHENVVAVFDAGRMPDGSPYLVVQRLHGDTLATRLGAAAPLPVTEAVDVTRQVLNALAALSEAGVTHRDVKPDNIVLDRLPDGRTVLKLVDFGIAKEAHDEASRELDEMVGTPGYMAPEQVRGESIDARCDLYALGATLYEMLTGQTPHTGDTVHQVAMATLFGTIPPLQALRADCPEDLAQIVMRALAREPSDRFASACEMKSALDRWQAVQGPSSSPGPAPEQHDTEAGPHVSLEPAHEQHDIEDTLRIYTPNAPRRRSRSGLRARGIAAIACLAALGALVLSQVLHGDSPAEGAAEAVTALALQASDLAPLELTLPQASALANALVARSSAWAAGLLTEARTSALLARSSAWAAELSIWARTFTHEMLDAARRSAPAWGAAVFGSAQE